MSLFGFELGMVNGMEAITIYNTKMIQWGLN